MPDIFVSYASADRDAAFRIVGFLEGQGIHCWVAPRDVAPGVEYGHAIINAIEHCKALVLVLSDQSNDSQFVRKEVERAVSKTKVVLPVRIREVTPSGSLEWRWRLWAGRWRRCPMRRWRRRRWIRRSATTRVIAGPGRSGRRQVEVFGVASPGRQHQRRVAHALADPAPARRVDLRRIFLGLRRASGSRAGERVRALRVHRRRG